jgi:hypothetical protein
VMTTMATVTAAATTAATTVAALVTAAMVMKIRVAIEMAGGTDNNQAKASAEEMALAAVAMATGTEKAMVTAVIHPQ